MRTGLHAGRSFLPVTEKACCLAGRPYFPPVFEMRQFTMTQARLKIDGNEPAGNTEWIHSHRHADGGILRVNMKRLLSYKIDSMN